MKLQKETAQKITRDIIISLFIYALPVVLMFLTFYITGEKPWDKKENIAVQSEIKNNNR
ncbi:MAG: fatty acid hydroxylase [Chitinophagaceae bacterium]|nr:fatty acid hydroxylase [Chitinophagaceae bacterium]